MSSKQDGFTVSGTSPTNLLDARGRFNTGKSQVEPVGSEGQTSTQLTFAFMEDQDQVTPTADSHLTAEQQKKRQKIRDRQDASTAAWLEAKQQERWKQQVREDAWCEWLLNVANHLDGTQAVSYRRRAEQGDPEAQFQFARLLKEGVGVRLNRVTAYKWLELAASQTADENIQSRASTVRRLMALEMTPVEVAEGQRLAAAWNSALDTSTNKVGKVAVARIAGALFQFLWGFTIAAVV